jgi:hypothetical protein
VDDEDDPVAAEVAEMHAELGEFRKVVDGEMGELRSELRTSMDSIQRLIRGMSGRDI